MSQAAIIGMVICLTITFGGFLTFLVIALKSDKKKSDAGLEE
ncbi:MetS family NSS transporter small subunit [Roseivirga echinicomitans]|nr:MetS family NSS transporter small subunit [Roseivirga echinicomitans]